MTQPFAIVQAEQMRALEATALRAGLSEDSLQANAAEQVSRAAARLAPTGSRLVVLVGKGNNGRDAFLAGRLLAARGRWLYYHLAPQHALADAELEALAGPRERFCQHDQDPLLESLAAELRLCSVALDGLLGIGARGPARPPLDRLIQQLNASSSAAPGPRVVSVDLPSGIDANTGQIPGEAVRAHLTVALGAVKAGTLRFPAAELVGEVEPRPIGLPAGADAGCAVRLLTSADVSPLMPDRPLSAHKGTLGWLAVLGGSPEYIGAPILSASAAARAGCGLVALAVPPVVQTPAAAVVPEATFLLRDEREPPALQAERLQSRLSDFASLVVGPGLGRSASSQELVRALLAGLARQAHPPPHTVVDADALYALAHWPEWWKLTPPGAVLTPHHGEMARLTGLSAAEIERRAWEVALEAAAKWGQIVVLKSAHTVVAAPDGRAWVYPRANPALATAGTGDVLAGLIGGLISQGSPPLEAARLGVVVHALAAEQAIEERASRSLIASDLPPALPRILRRLVG